jgi:hypothetical protein
MRKFVLLCASFFTMVLLASGNPARAQGTVWVSATGSGNQCTAVSPCGSFATAMAIATQTSASRISCLTGGNYGPVTINRSIIIDCGTGNVGIVSNFSGGNAITINANSAVTVILRHLAVDGNGTTNAAGVSATFVGGTLVVEDCSIQGFAFGYGIYFAPTSSRGLLQVSNSQIFNNATGIGIAPASGQIASVTLNQVELVANSNLGLALTGNGIVAGTMRNSVAGENLGGIYAGSGQVFFTIDGSSIVDNTGSGIQTDSANSIVNVGASTIGGNGTGVQTTSGQIISFGNNQMSVNAVNGTFTSTTALQ